MPALVYINYKLATSLDGQADVLEADPVFDGACEGFAFGDGEGMVGAYGYLFGQGDVCRHVDGGGFRSFQRAFQRFGCGNAYGSASASLRLRHSGT